MHMQERDGGRREGEREGGMGVRKRQKDTELLWTVHVWRHSPWNIVVLKEPCRKALENS